MPRFYLVGRSEGMSQPVATKLKLELFAIGKPIASRTPQKASQFTEHLHTAFPSLLRPNHDASHNNLHKKADYL
jgi:hypothetical protein